MDANIKVEKTDEKKVDVDELFRALKNEIEGGGSEKKAPAASVDIKVKLEAESEDQVKPSTSEEKPVTDSDATAEKDPLLDEFYSEVFVSPRISSSVFFCSPFLYFTSAHKIVYHFHSRSMTLS